MHPGTLRALEFDRIIEALRSLALTPLGDAGLSALQPEVDPRKVEASLAATTEGVALLEAHRALPLRSPADLDVTLQALAFEGRPLEPGRLLGLADFLESAGHTRELIRKRAVGPMPALSQLAESIASFDREADEIRQAIDPSGMVVDTASPELRQLRDRVRRLRSRLRGTLESYLRGRDTARYLQDQVVTDRNGRYVLIVRAEHRQAIPGIVHGSSASGASLYLEPLSTVELNNEIVATEEQEREEVRRILLRLTDSIRLRALDLRRTVQAAGALDVVQAKARFAQICRAASPALSIDGRFELRGARHPLLIPAVVSRTTDATGNRIVREAEPVPVDVVVVPPNRALVITGPNTGGKTVALKTAGLLALMAQAGLHIPAEGGSSVPVFQTIFADIGDEQSIAANLSTFSWHITNIAGMDRLLRVPALVLLDEVGAGTDPVEGGALGMAVIDHFRQRGAIVIATTHFDALKTYASTTADVLAAAFGFDPETFAPTYRIMYGSPGTSLALEMSTRLGLPASIVNAARAFRSARETQLAEHLAKVDHDLQALDHERRLVGRERAQLEAIESQFRSREEALRRREEQFRRRLDEALEDRLREARREIDAVVDEVRRKAAALADVATDRARGGGRLVPAGPVPGNPASSLSTGETGSLRGEARQALEIARERLRRDSDEPPQTGGVRTGAGQTGAGQPGASLTGVERTIAVEPGMRVTLPLGLEGVVQTVHDRMADVTVNGKRVRASVSDLRVLGPAAPLATHRVTVSLTTSVTEGGLSDLNVIGCTSAEALERADKFLDQALMAELRQVRFIHGHGTGQLRRALAAFLADHPQVARISAAPADQGGGGVTVVDLKE